MEAYSQKIVVAILLGLLVACTPYGRYYPSNASAYSNYPGTFYNGYSGAYPNYGNHHQDSYNPPNPYHGQAYGGSQQHSTHHNNQNGWTDGHSDYHEPSYSVHDHQNPYQPVLQDNFIGHDKKHDRTSYENGRPYGELPAQHEGHTPKIEGSHKLAEQPLAHPQAISGQQPIVHQHHHSAISNLGNPQTLPIASGEIKNTPTASEVHSPSTRIEQHHDISTPNTVHHRPAESNPMPHPAMTGHSESHVIRTIAPSPQPMPAQTVIEPPKPAERPAIEQTVASPTLTPSAAQPVPEYQHHGRRQEHEHHH